MPLEEQTSPYWVAFFLTACMGIADADFCFADGKGVGLMFSYT